MRKGLGIIALVVLVVAWPALADDALDSAKSLQSHIVEGQAAATARIDAARALRLAIDRETRSAIHTFYEDAKKSGIEFNRLDTGITGYNNAPTYANNGHLKVDDEPSDGFFATGVVDRLFFFEHVAMVSVQGIGLQLAFVRNEQDGSCLLKMFDQDIIGLPCERYISGVQSAEIQRRLGAALANALKGSALRGW